MMVKWLQPVQGAAGSPETTVISNVDDRGITDRSGAQRPEDQLDRHESKGHNPCGQAAPGALSPTSLVIFGHRPQ
eukprot:6773217-Prymnesium_polylepis.2